LGLSLRLTFCFHSYLHYYFIDFFQMWFISLLSMAYPSTHFLTPLLTLGQGQGNFWRVLDLGLSLRLTFGFHSWTHYYYIDFFQMWFITLVSMAHPFTHILAPLLTLGQGNFLMVLDLGLSLRLTFGFQS
jgi:hypothetical protein